jgi:hypothetical protein
MTLPPAAPDPPATHPDRWAWISAVGRWLVLNPVVGFVVPTISTVAFNRLRMPDPAPVPDLGDSDWVVSELSGLFDRSNERRQDLEGKGPGLSTVTAILVAGAIVAIASGWNESTVLGRVLLVIAAVYASFSVVAPLYLVGPLKRFTITVIDLEAAARTQSPELETARRKARAAMFMDVANQKLANLLSAGRNESAYAFAALFVWVVLVPLTSVLMR